MQARDDDWTNYLAIRAAWLSFVGGRTQGEIASQLGISPAKVHRLIAHAQKAGYVKFHVEGRPLECLELEELLTDQFNLRTCIIAPDLGAGDQESAIRAVASAGAHVLAGILGSPDVKKVGVGMGRTLKAAVEEMPRLARPDLAVMSICGSLTRTLAANPYDVVQLLQDRTGGEGYYLPVPYFAETLEEKEMFLGQRSVQDLLGRARKADVFVVGIGSVEEEGHLIQRGMITAQEQEELDQSGAASDLMGRFLTLDGEVAPVRIGDCAVGLHFNEVKGSRLIALVGGETKVDATLAALRAGVITDLIADETLARALRDRIGLKLAQSA
ncbi:MarR family transcriptional regulator [Roseibium polysiphoniae]|uniref:MarR family transcriptional regulator n=1 Tax=Roseibium polysiphoniae TaxID=2571221 RepID=A0A944CH42_9HYPH|nr:sugar-binding domain-containing protein [Roseibium polysiphoniae]MBS8262472.1 MarR family transcriptional regulator [Roseibium polysiphoniae]